MATIIYDNVYGARTTKVFGCSFKSITAQMGFNSQPIVFTVTVVEENSQDFTLDRADVRSAQSVRFGELSLLGIVQSWEKTVTDPNGTGIYTVRLTDCRTVLDAAQITNVYIDQPDDEVILVGTNVIYIGSEGDAPTIASPSIPGEDSTVIGNTNREQSRGVLFSTVVSRVEAATLNYGNNTFEVDMSALSTLTNLRGEGVNQYYIEGEIRSLVSTITEFCNAVGAEWWVESRRKSIEDDTIVIEIKVIRRTDGVGNPNAIGMDAFVALHEGNIIRRKEGYENQDITTNKVIWGGIKRKLERINQADIKPFWGFGSDGQPLDTPSYTMPDEPQYRRIDTTVEEMESAINGDLDDLMDSEQLAAMKRYIDGFWGKRFYFALDQDTMSSAGNSLPSYPEVVSAGWWEGDTPPHGVRQFDPDVLVRMTTEDGRWGSFVRLPNLYTTGSGTAESPIRPHYITWQPVVQNSNNLISRESEAYMRCGMEQYGRYVVMSLPVALSRYVVNEETEIINEDRKTRHSVLSRAWIPIMDRGIHYGPWSSTSLVHSRVPSPGRSEVYVDRDLVPWIFGIRGLLHPVASAGLTDLAARKIDTIPELSVIDTGQLEVVGVPQVNIGQSVGLGGSITEVTISFGENGVTTRYVMNLYTRELGEFKRKKQKQQEEQQEEEEKEPEDEFPETKDDTEEPPEPEPAPEAEEPESPTAEAQTIAYQKPEGGLGVISVKEGGPFYAVRRLNYQDINPNTFAGGLDTTGSYFLAEWTGTRNLAEAENSPGLLPVGTRVTVSIFSNNDERGPWVPYIEQTPQVFSPPPIV